MADVVVDSKRCPGCVTVKDISAFARNRARPDGRNNYCRECSRERSVEHNRANPAMVKIRRERWALNHPGGSAAKQRRHREAHPEIVRARTRAERENHPTRVSARKKVHYALKTGLLVRPDRCEGCGSSTKVQAHHEDYERPLSVRWLCARCHKSTHLAGVE